MTEQSIYGDHLPEMEEVMQEVLDRVTEIRTQIKERIEMDPVEHCLARIKTDQSMREKCRRKNLPETTETALEKLHDAIGVRIVCAFRNDVYTIRQRLAETPGYEVIEEKDYIKNAKESGYRSYHLILRIRGYFVEVQLRTISMDTWAALEHHLQYKKDVQGNKDLIRQELKRCADELASTDISMQTIRNMIRGEE